MQRGFFLALVLAGAGATTLPPPVNTAEALNRFGRSLLNAYNELAHGDDIIEAEPADAPPLSVIPFSRPPTPATTPQAAGASLKSKAPAGVQPPPPLDAAPAGRLVPDLSSVAGAPQRQTGGLAGGLPAANPPPQLPTGSSAGAVDRLLPGQFTDPLRYIPSEIKPKPLIAHPVDPWRPDNLPSGVVAEDASDATKAFAAGVLNFGSRFNDNAKMYEGDVGDRFGGIKDAVVRTTGLDHTKAYEQYGEALKWEQWVEDATSGKLPPFDYDAYWDRVHRNSAELENLVGDGGGLLGVLDGGSSQYRTGRWRRPASGPSILQQEQ